ncbi:MAG: undecaprenyl-diphosphate phosphatase [Bacillota bacterium]|jgi:undecaprenyl-diphosphatase
MGYMEIIILAIIQGLTEFFPVSSSGHLVVAQDLLGISSPGVVIEVVLHLGTLLSVIFVFWRDIVGLWRGFLSLLTNPRGTRPVPREVSTYRRLIWLLIVGIIPTAAMGLFLEPMFDRLFDSVIAVGFALLITGIVLFLISRARAGRRSLERISFVDALVVGLAQGCAITPGLSRSGMTISSALGRGLTRDAATRYSFLLSLPAIAGAAILKFGDIYAAGIEGGLAPVLLIGFLVAALAGIVAIKLLIRVLNSSKLQYFAYYVWVLGLVIIWRAR